jgi:DNA polymerase III sliding clamp (beta) subunit (PCNA family)
MKFTIDPSKLLEVFQLAAYNLGSDAGGPLSNFRLSLTDQVLTVASCDGATTLSFKVPVDGEHESGTLCLPAKTFIEAVKEFQGIEGPVIFSADDVRANIDWGVGCCSLPVFDTSGHPEPRTLDAETAKSFTLDAEDVLVALKATVFASQTSNINNAINAVNVRCSADGLVSFAATNLMLLSVYRVPSRESSEVSFSIPILVAIMMMRLFKHLEGPTTFSCDGKNFVVRCGDMKMASWVLPYKYPDYESILRRERGNNVFAVEAAPLLSCVRCALAMGRDSVNSFSFVHDVSGVRLEAKVPGRRTAFAQTLQAESQAGDLEIFLPALQMEDILKNIPFKRLRLVVDQPNLPCFLEDADEDINMTMMLMPLHEA